MQLFNNRYIVNWAIFSTARHPVLRRVLSNIVDVFKTEYFEQGAIKKQREAPWYLPWHSVICSTGPSILTASMRELLLENRNASWVKSMSIEDAGFRAFGGECNSCIYVSLFVCIYQFGGATLLGRLLLVHPFELL